MFGIINVNKEKNMTSFDIIAKLRKILNEKKIGHTGTLDPNATGVLPICIGNATKLAQYILNENKQYMVHILFGIETDSGDITGKVINKEEYKKFSLENINDVLRSFIGKSNQIPPMYSAIKVNGKKLYQLARQGIEIDRLPRPIEIYNIENIIYDSYSNILSFSVDCTKGTYIRSLCKDICDKLKTIGTIKDLQRTKTGIFNIEDAITLAEIEKLVNTNEFDNIFYNIEEILNFPKININDKWTLFENGVKLTVCENFADGIYKVYNHNTFKGLGIIKNNVIKREFIMDNYY